ncbi:hypothetical protein A9Q99_10785 [Gammaproteobacteria bacterium 45_16_T64]|nr:hypothetical protein A9Q99_10785 [Gammaproteobacteria bacterium 45_16_T64]
MLKSLYMKFTVLLPAIAWLAACGGGGPGIDEEGSGAGGADIAIAYIKRTLPTNPELSAPTESLMDFESFREGSAGVFIRNTAGEHRITPATGDYDIRQLTVNYDASSLLFAMRGPLLPLATEEGEDDPVQPAWGLWEYAVDTQSLVQITTGDSVNHIHDIDPVYLSDNRILFSSSRQETTMRTLGDEGKVQYRHLPDDVNDDDEGERTFNLHILGTSRNIDFAKQVTFNQSHDFNPSMMADGRVLFSRWDKNDADAVSVYRMNPDGSGVELLFGHNSPNVGLKVDAEADPATRYARPKELADGRILVELKFDNEVDQSYPQYAILNVENYIDETVAVPGGGGTAVELGYLGYNQTLPSVPNIAGRLSSAVPTDDGTGRNVISLNLCHVLVGGELQVCTNDNLSGDNVVQADLRYQLFMEDPANNTRSVLLDNPEEGVYYKDLVVVKASTSPSFIAETVDTGDADLVADGWGLLHIRSVYNLDGTFGGGAAAATTLADMKDPTIVGVDERPARFLRISRRVPQWDENTREVDNDFLQGDGSGMKEILGYAEIEPDGSVMTRVPADVAFSFSMVDAQGVRISFGGRSARHDNWVHVRPGETLTCTGCHNNGDAVAHGRSGALDTVNTGAPASGYPNTDPAMATEFAETMAQTRARLDNTYTTLSADFVFDDVWGEPGSKVTGFSYTLSDMVASFDAEDISYLPPVNFQSCVDEWRSNCRMIINYETHIHPIWSKPRLVLDPMDSAVVLEDHTCVSCHNHQPDPANADDPRTAGNSHDLEIPDDNSPPIQQLYLGDDGDIAAVLSVNNNNDRYEAYDFLRANHPRGVVAGGALMAQISDDIVFSPIQAVDGDGAPIFDEDGAPVFTDVCEQDDATAARALLLRGSLTAGNAGGTRVSMIQRGLNNDPCAAYYTVDPLAASYNVARSFFTKMESAPNADFATNPELDHRDWLTGTELKLLREWMDMGGQYFNNPFDAPSD